MKFHVTRNSRNDEQMYTRIPYIVYVELSIETVILMFRVTALNGNRNFEIPFTWA